MRISIITAALGIVLSSSLAKAEVLEVGGVAQAYFPNGNYVTVVATPEVSNFAYADEAAMAFYTLSVFSEHGVRPACRFLRSYAKAQEETVKNGESGLFDCTNTIGSKVDGSFYLGGTIEGTRYEKICRFLMNEHDHGSWCIATLGQPSDDITKRLLETFHTYGDDFKLLKR